MKDFAIILICLISGIFVTLKYIEYHSRDYSRDDIPDSWKDEIKGLYQSEDETEDETEDNDPILPASYYKLLDYADALEDKAKETIKYIGVTYYKYPADKRSRLMLQAAQNREKADKILSKYTRQ